MRFQLATLLRGSLHLACGIYEVFTVAASHLSDRYASVQFTGVKSSVQLSGVKSSVQLSWVKSSVQLSGVRSSVQLPRGEVFSSAARVE